MFASIWTGRGSKFDDQLIWITSGNGTGNRKKSFLVAE